MLAVDSCLLLVEDKHVEQRRLARGNTPQRKGTPDMAATRTYAKLRKQYRQRRGATNEPAQPRILTAPSRTARKTIVRHPYDKLSCSAVNTTDKVNGWMKLNAAFFQFV